LNKQFAFVLILACLTGPSCQLAGEHKRAAEVNPADRQRLEQAVVLAHQIATSLDLSTGLATGGFSDSEIAPQLAKLTKLRAKAIPDYIERIKTTAALRDPEFDLLLDTASPQLSQPRPGGTLFSSSEVFDMVLRHLNYARVSPRGLSPQMVETDVLSLVRSSRIPKP
jgi:hypothetical protein